MDSEELLELAEQMLEEFGTKEKLITVTNKNFDVELGDYATEKIETDILLVQNSQKTQNLEVVSQKKMENFLSL